LYLLVKTTGAKLWRYNYRFAAKRKTLALGKYPDVSLADARQRHADARRLLADNTDPGAVKKAQKETAKDHAKNTFEAVFLEWHTKMSAEWSDSHTKRVMALFGRDLLPWLGKEPIAELCNQPRVLLRTFERIQERGAIETGQRAKQQCGQLFAYAFGRELCERNPIPELKGQLITPAKENFPALTKPDELAQMLRDIKPYNGTFITRCALHIWPFLIVRPRNIAAMEWAEIDFDAALWTIPAVKMKMRNDHLVPLAHQALAILREVQPFSGHGQYVFPGRGKNLHISENTLNHALYKCGDYQGRMCGHGMRGTFKTLGLEVLDYSENVIGAVLAHKPKDVNGTAYNRATYLQQRKVMLQAWADYLDSLRDGTAANGGNVVNIHVAKIG
jgi:integrase